MKTTIQTKATGKIVNRRLTSAVLITLAVWFYIRLVGIALGHSTHAGPLVLEEFPVIRDIIIQLLRGVLAVAIALSAVRIFDITSPLEWMRIRRPNKWDLAYVSLGVVVVLAWIVGSLIVIQNVLGFERTTLFTLSERMRLSRVVTLLILVGPAEEVIFHGVIQRSLEDVIGLWPAIFLGGTLFMIPHVSPAALSTGDILFYGVQGGFGMIVGWFYARTDNLVVPALIHGIFVSFTTALPLLFG